MPFATLSSIPLNIPLLNIDGLTEQKWHDLLTLSSQHRAHVLVLTETFWSSLVLTETYMHHIFSQHVMQVSLSPVYFQKGEGSEAMGICIRKD
jgi:hypothetical protein